VALAGTGRLTGLAIKAALVLALGAQPHTYTAQTATPIQWYDGIAAHYAPGVMERVSRNRGLLIVGCMIASPRHKIGQWVIVEGRNTGKRLRCRVTDTSAPVDKARHLRTGLFELDFRSAIALCGSSKLPNRQCPIRVTR